MKRNRNLIVGVVLTTVAAAATVLTTVSVPEVETPTEAIAAPTTVTVEATGEMPVTSQGNCGYQWAYNDAPELTASLDAAVKEINSDAFATAQYFGENCVYADGTFTFGALETDFYVRLPVDDLAKEDEFGNWVALVMEIVVQIPREDLQGPQYGFVEFTFEKSETERIIFRVPIQKYLDEARGKSDAELYRMFYPSP